jgi:hypothetical protein
MVPVLLFVLFILVAYALIPPSAATTVQFSIAPKIQVKTAADLGLAQKVGNIDANILLDPTNTREWRSAPVFNSPTTNGAINKNRNIFGPGYEFVFTLSHPARFTAIEFIGPARETMPCKFIVYGGISENHFEIIGSNTTAHANTRFSVPLRPKRKYAHYYLVVESTHAALDPKSAAAHLALTNINFALDPA